MIKWIIILLFPVFSFGQIVKANAFYTPIGGANCVPSDTDAAAYASAVGLQSGTLCTAIDSLVTQYKRYGLWTKRKAIYLLMMGTSSACKYNLKDPRDLDAAFRLTYSGTITFNTTGATGNGTTGYANTYVNVTSNLTQYSTTLGVFARSNVSQTGVDMGAYTTGAANDAGYPSLMLRARYTDDKARSYAYGGYFVADGVTGGTDTDSRGVTEGVRASSTDHRIYKNGTQTGTTNTATATNTRPNYTLFIWAANANGSAANFSSKELIAAWIGDGINSTEASNENTVWQTFKTTMGL